VTSAISRPSRDQTWSGCSPCSRTLQLIEFKQMGVGLAAAILIDATVIRGVLLPATLALLGERAWYLTMAGMAAPRCSAQRAGPTNPSTPGADSRTGRRSKSRNDRVAHKSQDWRSHMLLALGVILLIIAIAGGVVVHPLLFLIAVLALLSFFGHRRAAY
jgi:beta-lactamase regulating signal transducer with metallopeptidase domain